MSVGMFIGTLVALAFLALLSLVILASAYEARRPAIGQVVFGCLVFFIGAVLLYTFVVLPTVR